MWASAVLGRRPAFESESARRPTMLAEQMLPALEKLRAAFVDGNVLFDKHLLAALTAGRQVGRPARRTHGR